MTLYKVWWKRQDEWKELESFVSLQAALDYANNSITHGHITQRIEIRDGADVIRTVYDASW